MKVLIACLIILGGCIWYAVSGYWAGWKVDRNAAKRRLVQGTKRSP